MAERKCPECNGTMERRFVVDTSYGASFQSKWHRGFPEEFSQFWSLLPSGAIREDPVEMIDITTYRCIDCGALRSYALG